MITPARTARRRLVTDRVMTALFLAAIVVAVAPLVSVLGYIVAQGVSGITWAFFTRLPAPVGEGGGGMANALVGTLTLIALASGSPSASWAACSWPRSAVGRWGGGSASPRMC